MADCWVSDEISGRQRRMLADNIKVLTSEAGDTSVNSGHLFDTTETGSEAWSSDVFASNGEATAPFVGNIIHPTTIFIASFIIYSNKLVIHKIYFSDRVKNVLRYDNFEYVKLRTICRNLSPY